MARYEEMMRQCPFALATPAQPAVEEQTSFAANWYVSGIGRMDGEDFVIIKSRDLATQFSLYGHDANSSNGVMLASIEWADKIGKSTVIIKKGSETAKLEFNEAELRGPALATASGSAPGGTPPGNNPSSNPTPPQSVNVRGMPPGLSRPPLQQPAPVGKAAPVQTRVRVPMIKMPPPAK